MSANFAAFCQPPFSKKSVFLHDFSVSCAEPRHPENPYEEYNRRLANVHHKILVAFVDDRPVGFKVGYALDQLTFYSWMGGVMPEFRRLGIARRLAANQEQWAGQNGYRIIKLKTRNIHKRMLIFALKSGFFVEDVELKNDPDQHRIHMIKHI